MVPVIRNAENLTFKGVESEVKRLALRARDGQITVDEMTEVLLPLPMGESLDRCCPPLSLTHHKVLF